MDLGGWARRETTRVARARAKRLDMGPQHDACLAVGATGSLDYGADANTTMAACEMLATLEYDIERLCLRFCGERQMTPIIPVLVLVQVLLNIRRCYDADGKAWADFVGARLRDRSPDNVLLALARRMHQDLLAKMPRGRPG